MGDCAVRCIDCDSVTVYSNKQAFVCGDWICPACGCDKFQNVEPTAEDKAFEAIEARQKGCDGFQKLDTDKNMLELIEPAFILGVGRILTFGAKKYGIDNWKEATEDDIRRIKGALLRHQMAYLSGERIDPETNEPHLYHIGCNTMFLDYFDRQRPTLGSDVNDSNK